MPWISLPQLVVPSSDFADILVRGQAGGHDALSEGEKIRFDKYFTAHFVVYEQNFRALRRNSAMGAASTLRLSVDKAIKVRKGLANQGSREWWVKSKPYYQPEFVAWVDQNISID